MSAEWHRTHINAGATEDRIAEDLRVQLAKRWRQYELIAGVVVACAVLLGLITGLIPLARLLP